VKQDKVQNFGDIFYYLGSFSWNWTELYRNMNI
jgi:hypothetical protein